MNSTVCAECGNDSGANDFCDSCLLWRDAAFFERARIIAWLREEAQKAEGQCATAPAMRIRVVEIRRMADLLESEAS